MSCKYRFWQECTEEADVDALWSDPAVATEWINAGENKGENVHLSRDPYGQPYLTQTEMRAVAEVVIGRHFGSSMNLDMIFTIAELESARQPFASDCNKTTKEITYGLMQLSPKTAEWLFRERSEEFVVRAFKGGIKKATHKSTLPYWKRYLSVKESLPSRESSGYVQSPAPAYVKRDPPTHPSSTQDDSQRYWDSRASPEDMQELWNRRGVYREWMNSQQKKGSVKFVHDERKRPYLSQMELLAVAEIIFTKHFNNSKGITPAVYCALAEVVSMRYVDGVGSKHGLMGIEYETAKTLYNESGYKSYKVKSAMDLKNPFASMYFAAAYLCSLSQYEDRERSPRFVIQAYLFGPENANEDNMGPGYCKYRAELNNYETMKRDQEGCIIM